MKLKETERELRRLQRQKKRLEAQIEALQNRRFFLRTGFSVGEEVMVQGHRAVIMRVGWTIDQVRLRPSDNPAVPWYLGGMVRVSQLRKVP